MGLVETVGEALSTAFLVWVALGCLLGLFKPTSFTWLRPQWTILGITVTMLGMDMTLTLHDLRGALAMPKELLTGFLLQYSVMPVSGFLVSKLLRLPSYYAAGLILVACCPGGTASNIVTYIARLDDSGKHPICCGEDSFTHCGQFVAVDAVGLLISTLQVVSPLMPPIAVATVAVLCGNMIAQNASAILMSGRQVVLSACLLHASGFFFGYVLSRVLGLNVSSLCTISIKNSVLGVVLAGQHFGNPDCRTMCSFEYSIFGGVLAGRNLEKQYTNY